MQTQAPNITGIDVINLLIALGALVLGVLNFLINRSRVKISVSNFTVLLPSGTDTPKQRQALRILARNSGRRATTVVAWGFRPPNGNLLVGNVLARRDQGPPLPFTLEPDGEPGSWLLYEDVIVSQLSPEEKTAELQGFVELGGGKMRWSKNKIKLTRTA